MVNPEDMALQPSRGEVAPVAKKASSAAPEWGEMLTPESLARYGALEVAFPAGRGCGAAGTLREDARMDREAAA